MSKAEVYRDFLKLVRLGIGHSAEGLSANPDWQAIGANAARHGLMAVVVDGIGFQKALPPRELMLQWVGQVLQGYEMPYRLYLRAVASLARIYNAHGFKMMVLKGYACSLNWPKPEHRPCGDIDIWLFGKQKAADAMLTKEAGVVVDTTHHHHTVFDWEGFTVENHYDFVNVHSYRSSRRIEKLLKELGAYSDRAESVGFQHREVALQGAPVWIPSPNLHALFLMRHLGAHFAAISIDLRQLLDWGFFVERYFAEIDWAWLTKVLEEYHLGEFSNCINAICVEDLGFDKGRFPQGVFNHPLKERILMDILEPEFASGEPNGFIRRMLFKYRRWQGNAWKQRLCYDDNRFVSLWTGLGEHIFKPRKG